MISEPIVSSRYSRTTLIVLASSVVITCFSRITCGQTRVTAAERKLSLLSRKYDEAHAEFAAKLKELQIWCDSKQLTELSDQIDDLETPFQSDLLVSSPLPQFVRPPLRSDLPPDEREARDRLRRLRDSYGEDVYRLARAALRDGFASFAMHLVREVASHNPDHRFARALLGYVRYVDPRRSDERGYAGEWVTPYAATMRKRRHIWHDRFGWIPSAHLAKYQNGQRPSLRGSWISAERDAAIRSDFRNAWTVRTNHFEVKTNVSLERGVEVASALEEYHTFFFQTFAAFFETPAELQKRFQNANVRGAKNAAKKPPYKVHFYASKDEYIERLVKKIPRIALTNGLYYQGDQTSYFFENPDEAHNDRLYHEATHQFFDVHTLDVRTKAALNRARARRQKPEPWVIADKDDFWIIEGIACYMESFRSENGRSTLGDPGHIRVQSARYRLQKDHFYVPLREFTDVGMNEFQALNDLDIRRYYTQASGLAHFFMHFGGGQYREALVAHLSALYRPNPVRPAPVPTLAELTGVDFEQLDQQYRTYMSNLQATSATDGVSTNDASGGP